MTQENYSEQKIAHLAQHLVNISQQLELFAQSQEKLLDQQKVYQKDLDRLITIVDQVSQNQQEIANQQIRLVQNNENLLQSIDNLVTVYSKMVDQQNENKAATEHLERVVDYLLRRDKEKNL